MKQNNLKIKDILFIHASLPNGSAAPPDRGLVPVMNLLLKDRATVRQLWDEVIDIINCLNFINIEINGIPPTGTQWQDKTRHLDREILYAINLILHSSRTVMLKPPETCHSSVIEEIGKAGWAVSAALDAVLAGDCDNLGDWIATEAVVRNIELNLL